MSGETGEQLPNSIAIECAPVDMSVGELVDLWRQVEIQQSKPKIISVVHQAFSHIDEEELEAHLGFPDAIDSEQIFVLRHPDLYDLEIVFRPFGILEGMLCGTVGLAQADTVVSTIAKRYHSLGIKDDMICLALSGDKDIQHLAVLRENMEGDVEICIAAQDTNEMDHEVAIDLLQQNGLS